MNITKLAPIVVCALFLSGCGSPRPAADRVISSCEKGAVGDHEHSQECNSPTKTTEARKLKRPYSYEGGGARGARN